MGSKCVDFEGIDETRLSRVVLEWEKHVKSQIFEIVDQSLEVGGIREAFRYIDLQSLGWELNTDRIHLRVE